MGRVRRLPMAVTRARALRLLRHAGRIDAYRPDRLRNYEIEERLQRAFGRRWVVAEWCPFNGDTCEYRNFATETVKEEFWSMALPELREKGFGPGQIASWHEDLFAPSKPDGLDRRLLSRERELMEGK